VGNGYKGGLGYREAVEFFVPLSIIANFYGLVMQN
jgi:hypothetical protein